MLQNFLFLELDTFNKLTLLFGEDQVCNILLFSFSFIKNAYKLLLALIPRSVFSYHVQKERLFSKLKDAKQFSE